MSSLSSISGNQGLAQFFHRISNAQADNSTSATSATTSTTGTDASSASATAQGALGTHHHHHRGAGAAGGGKDGNFEKIQSAVTSALQSAQSGGGNTDPNKVIEDAIASVFKQAGATPPAPGASGGTPPTLPATPGATGATDGSDPDGDGDTDAAGKADSDGNSARQAFAQVLQQYGVSPQQFHADFLAAIKDAQGGQAADPSTVFKSFPAGTTVDTTA